VHTSHSVNLWSAKLGFSIKPALFLSIKKAVFL